MIFDLNWHADMFVDLIVWSELLAFRILVAYISVTLLILLHLVAYGMLPNLCRKNIRGER